MSCRPPQGRSGAHPGTFVISLSDVAKLPVRHTRRFFGTAAAASGEIGQPGTLSLRNE